MSARLGFRSDGSSRTTILTQCVCAHSQTYMPKFKVDFTGPSHFGGRNDEMVICAGKGTPHLGFAEPDVHIIVGGDIHIWDQESGILLHHIHPQAMSRSRDMTCLAWNRAHDKPFMFATGSYDGTVRIWTKRPHGSDDDPDNLENFDLGRNIPQTYSSFELDPRMDSTHPQPEESSHSQQSLLSPDSPQPQSEPQGLSMKQTFRQRILAYAAAQRALEAEAASQSSNAG